MPTVRNKANALIGAMPAVTCAGNNFTVKYAAHPIGPGIRPEDPERCITPDMCVSIFPNTYHPSGDGEPVKPHPRSFPFNNGYHWFGSDLLLDLRIRKDDCTYAAEECLVSLPADQQVKVERLRRRDMWREFDTQQRRDCALNADSASPQGETPSPPTTPTPESHQENPPAPTPSFLAYCDFVYGIQRGYLSKIERSSSDQSLSDQSTEDTPMIDVFDLDYNERDKLLPIVKIWSDVGAHSAEGVPDPMDFMVEHYWTMSIVQESKVVPRLWMRRDAARRPRVSALRELLQNVH
ncbi:hypothetical protein TRAPUB_716 [Trametes pubescens]|uniref:Uncharacterized protein n=1 Tax=Trametes pubescens TaxID=154538 RepID=A0A1M2VLC5_TRAPU|nr:hypothetical protein TRAPUB_716 [Trametes pubescens]